MIFSLLSGQLGIVSFLIFAVSLLLAVTVHEFSHAWVSEKLGDATARLAGRISLNPLAHLDPLGTLMILLTGFGWGKPVPVNPFNLESPLRDSAIISLAGPASNIIFAALISLPLRAGLSFGIFFYPLIFLNVALAVFNLIPIYPLDGFKVVGGILPTELALVWERTSPYGLLLILFFVFFPIGGSNLIGLVVAPLTQNIIHFLVGTSPLPF